MLLMQTIYCAMKIFISVLFIGFSLSSVSQEHTMHAKKDYKTLFKPVIVRGLGGSIQEFEGLNSRIANYPQYKELRNYAATLSVGWRAEHKRIISGSGIAVGSSMSGDRGKKSSTLRYISFNADLGYDLLKSEKIMLYPLAGLGVQAYQALFYRDNSGTNFNDVLQTPNVQNSITAVKFKNTFLAYRLGFGISVKSPKHPSSSIGIQAGYTGSFKKNDWKTNEFQVLNNAPEDRLSQFQVSLIVTSLPGFMH
jgi:opacity protein-like surface antigen